MFAATDSIIPSQKREILLNVHQRTVISRAFSTNRTYREFYPRVRVLLVPSFAHHVGPITGQTSNPKDRQLSGLTHQHQQPSRRNRVIGKIAFVSDRDGNSEIYSMDADGGGQTRLTEDAGEDHSPAWSPDGQRIAFVSTRDGNAEIYVMNADGSGQTRLTNNSAGDLAPAWTRDGSQIGFVYKP